MLLPVHTIFATKIYLPFLFCAQHFFTNKKFCESKPERTEWTIFIFKNLCDGGIKVYLYYIHLVCMFWYSKENPACVLWIDSTLWNTRNILLNIIRMKRKEKKRWKESLREMCPNMEFFLVRIFPHSDWIRRDTKYLSVFSPNAGKYEAEKTPHLDTIHAVNQFTTFPNYETFWELASGKFTHIWYHNN